MPKNDVLEQIKERTPHEPTFHQAVEEVYQSISPIIRQNKIYRSYRIFERIVEPERVVSFRINWVDDKENVQVHRGFRVQMNSALGPFKGGLRFDPTVNLDVLKFLAFEQIFKNALTGLPLGAGKGGANFDPKGKSDIEVMRFCQNFMSELYRHIGRRVDVPAGDIGVGTREIGYMFGTYKKLKNEFSGVMTGKGVKWGGSLIRTEATGYGLIFFAEYMLAEKGDSLEGKRCLVSGAGNVAQHAIEKILDLGGIPVTASDSNGYIYDEDGITREKLEFIKQLKNVRRGRIREYVEEYPEAKYYETEAEHKGNPLWSIPADCAFPCATQNEVSEKDIRAMIDNKVILLAEGANMPLTSEAMSVIRSNGILYGPGKASNAGGVAISGLEMSQNQIGEYWDRDTVEEELKNIMKRIHDQCLYAADEHGFKDDYLVGANIAGFIKVAESMIAEGVV